MENLFEKFVKEELDWICNDDMINILLENFEGELSEDELDDNIEDFINEAVKNFCNDEYVIQTMHDYMFDAMNDVIKDYLSSKE